MNKYYCTQFATQPYQNRTHLVVVEPQACMYVCTIACTQANKGRGGQNASIKYLSEDGRSGVKEENGGDVGHMPN